MSTRLAQYGIGVQAYEDPVEVSLSSSNWGWTANAVEVDYELIANSRLIQYGIVAAAYPDTVAVPVNLGVANWGWTSYNVDIPGNSYLLGPSDWGWTPHPVTACSQSDKGYYGSFNADVWPSCAFNEHVFGPRTHVNLGFVPKSWGWQTYPLEITFYDPVDVDLDAGNWGWFGAPVAVSYSYEIQLQVATYGWQSYGITAELPYDVDLQYADWGWFGAPIGVSYSYDVGLNIATWGWQQFPVTVEVPSQTVPLRRANWGWDSYSVEVRQASLLPDDYALIAEAVYQKLVDEGVIYKLDRLYRRAGCDPSYPQTFHTKEDGHQIVCGDITIEQTTDSKGNVTQTRQ